MKMLHIIDIPNIPILTNYIISILMNTEMVSWEHDIVDKMRRFSTHCF